MTVVLQNANTILLSGACPVDDAETLLQLLLDNPEAEIDWRGCESAHAAVVQVLLTAKRSLHGPPAGAFLDRFIEPALNAQV